MSRGYDKERTLDLPLAVLCTAPSEIDRSDYNFFLSDLATIRAKASALLEKKGEVTTMLRTLETKMNAFRKNNYEFVDIASDLRKGTTTVLDTVSSFLDSAFAAKSGEDEDEDDEEEEDAEGTEDGALCVQI